MEKIVGCDLADLLSLDVVFCSGLQLRVGAVSRSCIWVSGTRVR